MSIYFYKGQDDRYLLGVELDELERVSYKKCMTDYYAAFFHVMPPSCINGFMQDFHINIDMAYHMAELMVSDFANAKIPKCFEKILDSELTKKEQEKLLNEVTLTDREWDAIFYKAEEKGYTYSFYKYVAPLTSVEGKTVPNFIYKNEGSKAEYFGESTLSDKHMMHIVENAKIIIARIIDKGDHWHCFVQTLNGVKGHEGGRLGSKPHIHYISDKFGISRDELVSQIHAGSYSSSSVHILLSD